MFDVILWLQLHESAWNLTLVVIGTFLISIPSVFQGLSNC